jgi:cytochrome b subunit of formate dehydrogenase
MTANAGAARVLRHAFVDRLFHWVSAAAVLVLLATAFLPILGFDFAWVAIHWWAGIVLLAAVVFHVVRALAFQSMRAMWGGANDWRDLAASVRGTFASAAGSVPKVGKYSLAQKLIHLAFAVAVLATLVTGVLMLARVDTPFSERDPYWLAAETWGVVYVVHGLAALALVTMVMVHVYFALRPEKLHFTRAMFVGWITRKEYAEHHDPRRWPVDGA